MKKFLSIVLSLVILISAVSPSLAYAEVKQISSSSALKKELSTSNTCEITKDFNVSKATITGNTRINGNGHILTLSNSDADAMLCNKEYAKSSFSNVNIQGGDKYDVGIWIDSGSMTFEGSTISNFNVLSGRFSVFGIIGDSALTLNNTQMINNAPIDIIAYDGAKINILEGTSLDKIKIESKMVKLNIGDNWAGEFELDITNPVQKAIGAVGKNADISKIKLSNPSFHLENVDGKLWVKKDIESAIHFDMSQRDTLYKGSTGFLYGESEINVPSIDLLQGLKPDTMVQKAVGGLQHPTGDAVRTKSALLSAGVRDMQIYLQDNYLEWPYDAPMKDGKVDIDAYQKTVEKIVRQMINSEKDLENYSFVLFNEPDQIWFGWNLSGLEQAWKQIYTAVKNIYPQARCVGPNFSGFNAEQYDEFLHFCYDNNCLPEIISWHELGDISLTDFTKHYDSVMADVEKYYNESNKPELMVNEYARHYDIGSAGGIVKWLAMFEDKDMCGCMAYWAMANSLNEMAADQNSPTSTWWVYHWYAQMTGEQCPLTYPNFDETRFYGVSSYDEDINMGYILFGGSEDYDKSEVVYADNLTSTDLMNSNGAVNVKIYGVGYSGQHGANYQPELIFDNAVQTNDGTLRISVDNTDEMDAYFAVLTKPSDDVKTAEFENTELSTISYEAEDATLLGNAIAYHKMGWATFATSGRADVGSLNNNESGVQFEVEVPENATYKASIFYSLQAPYVNPQTLEPQANGQNRGIGKSLPYGVNVDGVELPAIIFESTVVWSYKNHCDIQIPLSAGKHTITYHHINGDESQKGNLQLTAAIDKLDLTKITGNENDFEIDLTEMQGFKTDNGYEVTAVAPVSGYYQINADAEVSLTKQAVDYAVDAKTSSECSTYDIPVGNVVYLSQGANTIGVVGNATKLDFIKVNDNSTIISASDISIHGENPVYKTNEYANSGKVIANIGVGQGTPSNYAENLAYFEIEAENGGVYNLAIRYSNDEPAPVMLKANGDTYVHPYNIDLVERYAQIVVNDNEPETVYFRNTMSWDTFKVVDVQVNLNKGKNTIKIYNDNSYQFSQLVNSTAPEIDEIKISRLTYDGTAVKLSSNATTGHTYDSGRVTKSATCTKTGIKTYTCTICGEAKAQTISAKGHRYTTKVVNPTYAEKGYTLHTCSVCKTSYKDKYTNKLTVSKPSISKVTSPKSKQIKVTWSKKAYTGYEVQIATNSAFTKNKKVVAIKSAKTTSKTFTGLKGKAKYYVRVRAYKTYNGKKYYSSWSTIKSATTKK